MKKFLKFAPLAMAGCAVLALIMIFLPQLTDEGDGSYSGLEIVFGVKEHGYEILKFSFLNLLTYLFVIAMAVVSVLAYMKKDNKLFLLIAIVLAIVSAVFFFLAKAFVQADDLTLEMIKEFCDLGVGAIFGGIFSILAAGVGVVKLVLDK